MRPTVFPRAARARSGSASCPPAAGSRRRHRGLEARTCLLPSALLLAALSGCTDVVRVFSEPSGAQLLVNGQERGTTPVAVMVNRTRKRISVELHHPGCRPLAELLRREPDGRPVPWQHFRLEPIVKGAAPMADEKVTAPAAERSGEGAPAEAADAQQEGDVP